MSLLVTWFGALGRLLFASGQSSCKASVALIFAYQVFKKKTKHSPSHSLFSLSILGLLFLGDAYAFRACCLYLLHAGRKDTFNYTFQYLVFSVVRNLLQEEMYYFLVEETTDSSKKWMSNSSAGCFAGLSAFPFLILINLEISNESILFSVIIGIHGLFSSPEWNWNIARKKVHEVNNIEHVEKQSLLSFLLALDGWQDFKNKHSF